MTASDFGISRHQREIQRNRRVWESKPLLREIYGGFYNQIEALIDWEKNGRVMEIGSGLGGLRSRVAGVLGTDLFPNPWLDVVCDGYELPFRAGTISHLILFDVFHHLEWPRAFLLETRRVLARGGRLILCEPYVSWFSCGVYGVLHPEPVAWWRRIGGDGVAPRSRSYYAAQGNATRLFFRKEQPEWLEEWTIFHAEVWASFSYLLSGGFSRRAVYPACCLGFLQVLDRGLSRWPKLFGARCLVGLEVV